MNYESGTFKIIGRNIFFGSKPVKLTNAETDYVLFLARHAGRTMNKAAILDGLYGNPRAPLWDNGHIPEHKIVDVVICKIRRKMQKVSGEASPINTVFGLGYNLPKAA